MKILIAGDSFCNKLGHTEANFSWTRQLEKLLAGSNVTCTGQGASSVFSALKQVQEQLLIDSGYDIVVVIVTNYERLYQTTEPIVSNLRHALTLRAPYEKSTNKDQRRFNKIEAARMYYEHLYEKELGIFILESCLKEIESTVAGRRLILFPAFETFQDSAFASSRLGSYGFTLLDIVFRENKILDNRLEQDWALKWSERLAFKDDQFGKVNHMSIINQTILARYFADLIEFGKSDINLDSFAVLSMEDFNLYYEPIQ